MRRGRIVECARCRRVRRNNGHGLCSSCFAAWNRKRTTPGFVCGRCHRAGHHEARGLCVSCYRSVYQTAHLAQHASYERQRRREQSAHIRELEKRRARTDSRRAWKKAYGRAYYVINKTRLQAYNRAWLRAHREQMNHYSAVYSTRKLGLPHTLSISEWNAILDHFDHRCAYCGRKARRLCREHAIPVSRGGGYTADNIVPACGSCNSRKHNKTPEEFAAYLKLHPEPFG